MREMIHNSSGAVLKVKEHIIVKNFWEYYVLDENNNPENPDIITCLVLGIENEIGDVSLSEIKPYIICKTNDLSEVMPAPQFSWVL